MDHTKSTKTLSTKLRVEDYELFVKKAKELGVSPSALLRKLIHEFLGKPIEEYDKLSKLEKEIERLKSDMREIRVQLDMVNRKIYNLERRKTVYLHR